MLLGPGVQPVGKERIRPALSVGAGTTQAEERAFAKKEKERRARERAEPMQLGPGVKPVGKEKMRPDLSVGAGKTQAEERAFAKKEKARLARERAKPMQALGPGIVPVGKEKMRPSLSIGAGRTLAKEEAFADAERAKWAKRADLKAIAEQAELPIREPGSAYPQQPARKKLVSRRKKKFSSTLLYGDSLVVPGAEVPGRSGIESAAARKLEGAATGKRPGDGGAHEPQAPEAACSEVQGQGGHDVRGRAKSRSRAG